MSNLKNNLSDIHRFYEGSITFFYCEFFQKTVSKLEADLELLTATIYYAIKLIFHDLESSDQINTDKVVLLTAMFPRLCCLL